MNLTPKKSIDAHSIPNFLLDRTSRCGGCEPNGKWWNLAELFAFSNGSSIDPKPSAHSFPDGIPTAPGFSSTYPRITASK